jgi:hypothetical protein
MVDGRVVERPCGGHRFFKTQYFGLITGTWLKWRPGGALRGMWRQQAGKVGEWICGKPAPPWLKPPPMSVKDRWVGPREQVLNVPVAYWWYGPGKPSSRLSIEAWLFPTAPLAAVGEKLGTDPWIGPPACCGLYQKPFLSGAVDLFKSVDDYMKGCYMWTTWDTYGRRPYADWAWITCGMLVRFPLQGVHRFKSPRLLDMSNRLFMAVVT